MKRLALRLHVVRGVLLGELELDDGARLLDVPVAELARVVAGARAAVIRELGPDVLDRRRYRAAM